MAPLIRPFINAGGFYICPRNVLIYEAFFDFTPNAFSPFDYSKRAFNDFPLRDSFTFGGSSDEVGKWNRHIFVFRFFWKPE